MRKNPYYRLKYIANVPYLLTFGQGNADFNRDLRLNTTGAFLWEQLDMVSDTEALIALCADYFQCPQVQFEAMSADVRRFVNTLYSKGILLPEGNAAQNTALYKTLEIAGLFFRLYGPANAFAKEFLSFETTKAFSDDSPVQEIRVHIGTPAHTECGTLLLRNQFLSVVEGTHRYILLFPSSEYLYEAQISKDGKRATVFCKGEITSEAQVEISYAIRICFLYFAGLHQMLAIHSASILYRDKLWLFAGPSGTGKSTHTELWHKLLGTPVINGDLNLICLDGGDPVVHGIPWCGTSGIYDTKSYPLGGVIFLQQGSANQANVLSEDRKCLHLLHRSISPTWTAAMQERNLHVIESFAHKVLLCQLTCTKEEDAVHCIKRVMDSYPDNN